MKSGNLSSGRHPKVKDQIEGNLRQQRENTENKAQSNRDKIRQKQQQYFAQQNQNEFQEFMQMKESPGRSRSESPRKEAFHKSRNLESKSPKLGGGRNKQYHILVISVAQIYLCKLKVSYLACVFHMTRPSDSTINFEHVTFTLTFDLLLKIYDIGHNFCILRDRAFIIGMCVLCDKAFIIGMCVPCDKAFPTVQ